MFSLSVLEAKKKMRRCTNLPPATNGFNIPFAGLPPTLLFLGSKAEKNLKTRQPTRARKSFVIPSSNADEGSRQKCVRFPAKGKKKVPRRMKDEKTNIRKTRNHFIRRNLVTAGKKKESEGELGKQTHKFDEVWGKERGCRAPRCPNGEEARTRRTVSLSMHAWITSSRRSGLACVLQRGQCLEAFCYWLTHEPRDK